jgi:hypothetical protein
MGKRSTKTSSSNKPKRNVPGSKRPAAVAPKGCCTIESPGAPDRDVGGLTQAECAAIENAHPDSVTHWVKGSCA